MDRKYRTYHHGKGLKKSDAKAPVEGKANSFIDVRFKDTGRIKRRRKLGSDGKAKKDVDMPQGNVKTIHVHTFDEKGKRSKSHVNASKKEQRERKKANRKRRQSYEQ